MADPGISEFSDFYRREARRLVRCVALATGEPSLAEDVVAEAFARAWSRWPQVRQHERPVAWVMRVALNESRSHFRRRKLERRKVQAMAMPDSVNGPEPPAAHIWRAVRRLPEQERALISLRYIADLSQDEIARVLGVPAGTVASGLSRARHRLGIALRPTHEQELT